MNNRLVILDLNLIEIKIKIIYTYVQILSFH